MIKVLIFRKYHINRKVYISYILAGSFFLGNLQDISNYDDFVFDFSPPNRGEEKVYLNNFENLPKSKSNKVNTF